MITSYTHKNKLLNSSSNSLSLKCARQSFLYVPSLLNNRAVKLLAIYNTLCIPLHNIFIKKEKYHELQLCGPVSNHY